jgi:hypothetical protein
MLKLLSCLCVLHGGAEGGIAADRISLMPEGYLAELFTPTRSWSFLLVLVPDSAVEE